MHRSGHSLIETVMALFMLAGITIFVMMIFDVGLQRSRASFDHNLARVLAERKLAEIRKWSDEGNYVSDTSLATYDGQSQEAADHPGFTVTVRMKPFQLESPARFSRGRLPTTERRVLANSCAKTEVAVTWGNSSMKLCSLVGESPRRLRTTNPVVIDGAISDPLGSGSSTVLSATAYDSNGIPIQDALFDWWVESINGNATMEVSRTGQKPPWCIRPSWRTAPPIPVPAPAVWGLATNTAARKGPATPG